MRLLLDKYLNSVFEKLTTWNTGEVVYSIPRFVWLRVRKPVNNDQVPNEFSSQLIGAKSVPERRMLLLRNVYVSRYGEVFKPFSLFLPSLEGVNNFNWYRTIKLFLRRLLKSKIIPIDGTSAVVHDQYSTVNYYHWMIEALPRLVLVQKLYPDSTIILPNRPKPFITATLEAFGVKDIVLLQHHEFAKASTLIFPELVYYDGVENESEPPANYSAKKSHHADEFFDQELIVFVRRKLLDHYSKSSPKPFRKVFVSRSLQSLRKLENEAEVLNILQHYGFETYFFEKMSFQEQIQLMRETRILVSVHGANMVNTIFLPEEARVIELMNKYFVNDAYYLLCATFNIAYYSVPCEMTFESSQRVKNNPRYFVNSADLIVDVGLLEEVLTEGSKEGESE